jgi:O-antigen/teichoic acid export membrane protein
MQNSAKKLLGQTAIYGLSSILGRFSYFLLTPLHTAMLSKEEYGINTHVYAIIGIAMVVLTYGLETAFFRHAGKDKDHTSNWFNTTQSFIVFSTIVITSVLLTFQHSIAALLGYANQPIIYYMLLSILAGELLVVIPFAKLRLEMRPLKFAGIRLSGIALNILANLYFFWLAPKMHQAGMQTPLFEGKPEVIHIFTANVFSAVLMVLLFTPTYLKTRWVIEAEKIKTLLKYGIPLMIAGLAGVANELIDRLLIKPILDLEELGVYGAVVKLAVFMSLIIQAYRYAIEPYIFSTAKEDKSREHYARIFDFLMVFLVLGMTAIAAGLDYIKYFINSNFHEGLHLVPILLVSQLILGLIMHISLWYKLADQTKYGMYLSAVGAVTTVALNFALLPIIGILGAALANLASHIIIFGLSITWGQKIFPVPYRFGKNALVFISGSALCFLFAYFPGYFLVKILLWFTFAAWLVMSEKNTFLSLLPAKFKK